MGNFVKLTVRNEDGNYLRTWIQSSEIKTLEQVSNTQAENNEGTCIFNDGSVISLIAFNETLDSLQ